MANILVTRFSALGDVAITLPAVHSLAVQHPEHQIYYATNHKFESLIGNLPSNVHFVGADIYGRHKGVRGIWSFCKEIESFGIDAVADMQNNLRSHIIDLFFLLKGKRIALRAKDKWARRKLLRKYKKKVDYLKPYYQRYADVINRLGYRCEITFDRFNLPSPLTRPSDEKWIGVAPFSAHNGKVYPIGRTEAIVEHYSKLEGYKVFLFGGGKKETEIFNEWVSKYRCTSLAGQYNLMQELGIMSQLNVMLSMDSANMHLASLVGTKVVSIWGPSHPAVGFRPWGQSDDSYVQVSLKCRPCSEWGAKPCYRRDWACMHLIPVSMVIDKIDNTI